MTVGNETAQTTIVEFVGPGGVGKTTVEPLVADRLGIEHYPGKKRHGFRGEPLPAWRVWLGRCAAVAQSPRLVARSLSIHNGAATERIRFAVDLARRARTARRAKGLGSGVLASGPIHALSMMAASTGVDVTPLVELATLSDVYVLLEADPREVTRRLAGRLETGDEELEGHEEWVGRYERVARAILSSTTRPSIEVDANPGPEQIAADVTRRLTSVLAERGSKVYSPGAKKEYEGDL